MSTPPAAVTGPVSPAIFAPNLVVAKAAPPRAGGKAFNFCSECGTRFQQSAKFCHATWLVASVLAGSRNAAWPGLAASLCARSSATFVDLVPAPNADGKSAAIAPVDGCQAGYCFYVEPEGIWSFWVGSGTTWEKPWPQVFEDPFKC